MILIPKFHIKDIVYLKTDPDLLQRIITAYKVTVNDITYEVSSGTLVSWHYDFELMDQLPQKENVPGFGL